MQQIVPDVYWIRGRAANAYLLVSDDGLIMIDSGMAGEADRIAAQSQAGGHALSDLHTIVLTHAHGDHIWAWNALCCGLIDTPALFFVGLQSVWRRVQAHDEVCDVC